MKEHKEYGKQAAIRVPLDLLEAIRKEMTLEDRSFSNMCVRLMREAIEARHPSH